MIFELVVAALVDQQAFRAFWAGLTSDQQRIDAIIQRRRDEAGAHRMSGGGRLVEAGGQERASRSARQIGRTGRRPGRVDRLRGRRA
jgi:hypothetical protein